MKHALENNAYTAIFACLIFHRWQVSKEFCNYIFLRFTPSYGVYPD